MIDDILTKPKDLRPVHFMGVCGAGMSALAELLQRKGIPVTGCDSSLPPGHDPEHMNNVRAVVYSSAVPKDHPELQRARALDIPLIRRAEALAQAVKGSHVIAIAGTHGKTTTTVMTTEALRAARVNATGIAGGRVGAWRGNLSPLSDRSSSPLGLLLSLLPLSPPSPYIVEADEYDRSFLALSPHVAVVTNVEADHLDIYSGIDDIRQAFNQFISGAQTVVFCADDKGAASLNPPSEASVITYGIKSSGARLLASDISQQGLRTSFNVTYDNKPQGSLELKVPGEHNVLNALAALACGISLGVSVESMRSGLEQFTGVDRRFQKIGDVAGVTIIDDYAHHPTEIMATLRAAREGFPGRRIIAAFQPHLYSRTRDFASEFGEALAMADVVCLTELYAARETPISGVSSSLVSDALVQHGKEVSWRGERTQLADALMQMVRDGDVVITLGAGDITNTGPELSSMLERSGK